MTRRRVQTQVGRPVYKNVLAAAVVQHELAVGDPPSIVFMKKQRKHDTPGRESPHSETAFSGQEPISKLCDELGLQPTLFYRRQKQFIETGAAFEQKRPIETVL
jgi:hypothetical protein